MLEILLVLSVISALLGIIIPRYQQAITVGKKKAHESERNTLNAQLALYYLNNETYPSGMTSSDWDDTDSSGSYTRYFPEGPPATCNNDTSWSINSSGYMETTGHTDHE